VRYESSSLAATVSSRLGSIKRTAVRTAGGRTDRVKILRYQTAELWMVPGLDDPRPRPMAYTCSECSEKEETRLLSVVLQAAPPGPWRRSHSAAKREARPRILLRVTRSQLDDINAEFATRARSARRRPDNRTDREVVPGRLVP
jgi:hypothetical protein